MNTQLLQKIGPSTLAIVWITQEILGPDCPHFPTFHYLFDGILTARKKREMSFFEGAHYGHKLFLLHTCEKYAAEHIKQCHNLIHHCRCDQYRQMLFVMGRGPLSQGVQDLIRSRLQSEYDIAVFGP